MNKATVIKVNGTEQELDHRPTLKEAQEIVEGYVELVSVGNNKTLVVNADGKTDKLPVNRTITHEYGSKIYRGFIVGDVIVLEGWKTVGG